MPKKINVINSIVEQALLQTKDAKDISQLRTLLAVILPEKYGIRPVEVARLLGLAPVRLSQLRAAYVKNQEIVNQPLKAGGRRNEVFSPEDEELLMDSYRDRLKGLGRGKATQLQSWIRDQYKDVKDEQGRPVKASHISLGSVYNLLKRDAERMELREQQRKGGKGKRGSRN